MPYQTAGALLILACYWIQLSTQDARESSKLLLFNNFLGSFATAVTSVSPRQWGTVLLEGSWAALAVAFLMRALLADRTPASSGSKRGAIDARAWLGSQ